MNVIVAGGPSWVGKTTLCRRLLARPELSGFNTLCWDAFKYTMAKSFGIEEANPYTFEQLGDDPPEAEAHGVSFWLCLGSHDCIQVSGNGGSG